MSDLTPEIDLSKVTAELAARFASSAATFFEGKTKEFSERLRLEFASTFTRYLDRITKKYCFIKTLFYSDSPRYIYDFYVLQDLKNSRGPVEDADVRTLLALGTRFLVTGTGGSGKSIFMRHLLLDAIVNTDLIPVYIELRNLNDSPKSIYDSIPMEFRLHGLSIEQPSIDKLLEKGRLLILLDGFDELSPEKRDGVRKDIRSLTSRFPDSKLIMTSRPETHSTGWHQFVEYALSPLSLDKIKTLVSHLDMDDASRIRFLTDLEDSLFESHSSFLSNPLLLNLMAVSYDRNASVPTKRHLFYSQVFDALWNQHDAMKDSFVRPRECGLLKDDFMDLFGAFSVQAYLDSRTSFSSTIAREYAARGASLLQMDSVTSESFLADLLSATCMIVKDGTELHYTHRSFQEYFTAHFLLRSTPGVRADAWDEILSRQQFDSVLELLYEMDPTVVISEFLVPSIQQIVDKLDASENAYLEYVKIVSESISITVYPQHPGRLEKDVYGPTWRRSPQMELIDFSLKVTGTEYEWPTPLSDQDPVDRLDLLQDYIIQKLGDNAELDIYDKNTGIDTEAVLKIAPLFAPLDTAMPDRVRHAATHLSERLEKFSSGMRSIFQTARSRHGPLE